MYLLHDENISYLFLLGENDSGKTSFMKKAKIYTMNRNCFTEDVWIDLRAAQKGTVKTILDLRLEREDFLKSRVKEIKRHSVDGRTVPLIVLDHCDDLMKYEYLKLIHFV